MPVLDPEEGESPASDREGRLFTLANLRRLVPFLAPLFLAFVLWLLRRELADVDIHEIRGALGAIPLWRLLAATAVTVLGFVALSGYDTLGFRVAGQKVAWPRIALASFSPALEPPRSPGLSPWRALLQLPRPAPIQRKIQPNLGTPLPGLPRRPRPTANPHQHHIPDLRRRPRHLHPLTP